MQFEKGQSDSSSNEWSPLQPGAEAASSPIGEADKADKKDKDKSSKKKSSTAITPEDVTRAFGGKGKEWRQRLELPAQAEAAQPTELPEGLIWLRAASNVQQQRLHAEQQDHAPERDDTDEPQPLPHATNADAAADQPSAGRHDQYERPALAPDNSGHEDTARNTERAGPPAEAAAAAELVGSGEPGEHNGQGIDNGRTETAADYAERPGRSAYGPQPESAESPVPPADFAPPLPPDPMQYRHFFWNERPSPEAESADSRVSLPPVYTYQQEYQRQMAAAEAAAPATVEAATATATNTARSRTYPSPTPPGLQRNAADVSRAAWFGLGAGWFFGRRGKRKAVDNARNSGLAEGRAHAASQEAAAGTLRRLEAEPLHNYPQAAGGRVFVEAASFERSTAAAKPAIAAEKAVVAPQAEPRLAPTPRTNESAPVAASMGKRELLRVAKTIRIEGISLKDVFNAKRIDEAGMRSVVETYLRGGDVRQKLTQEVIAKEKSFEVDPLSRQYKLDSERQATSAAAPTSDTAANVPEAEVLPSAGGTSEAPAPAPKPSGSKTALTAASAASTARRVVESGDSVTWLGVTAVVIIYSLIVMLLV